MSRWQISDAHADLTRHVGVARYTLSASGNRIFARMGSPITVPVPIAVRAAGWPRIRDFCSAWT